jgi:hypothetical protein
MGDRWMHGFGMRPLGEHPRGDGRIILKWIFEKWKGGVDWIDLAQNTDRWWVIVNAVTNLRVP